MRSKGITPGDGDARHGTLNGYSNLRCRCEDCKRANNVNHTDYLNRHPEQRVKNTARSKARYARLRAAQPPKPPREPRHGTLAEYSYYRCRCEDCRTAATAARRASAARRAPLEPGDPRHGSRTGYSTGCRCEDCRAAAAAAQRAWMARKRGAAKGRHYPEPLPGWQQHIEARFTRVA